MSWRVARSLDDLLGEVNAAAPHRAKGRDGTIGDTAHQARASRHNPNAAGVVTARDVTNDPAGGMPIHRIVRDLLAHPDEIPVDLDYVISAEEVASREHGPWEWRPYDIPPGGDPHDEHAHFGVGRGPDKAPVGPYDDPSDWHIAACLARINPPAPQPQEDDKIRLVGITTATSPLHGQVHLVWPDRRHRYVGSPDDLAALVKVYGPVIDITAGAFTDMTTND